MQPLNIILSKKCGSCFQMDLIEMLPYQDYLYILCIVEHLSKYGHVWALKNRTSLEVGKAIIIIIANSITPRILQSDNGGKVCILILCFLFFCFYVLSLKVYNCLHFSPLVSGTLC
jgi:hypothetical protein